MSFTIMQAVEQFCIHEDPEFIAKTVVLVQDGLARWVKDPEVQGTFGLVLKEDGQVTRRAFVVAYSPDLPWMGDHWDFEADEQFVDLTLSLRDDK